MSGARNIGRDVKSESQFFELFYDFEILNRYVEQTNQKDSNQAAPAWDVDHQLSVEELKHFFALDLYMDIVQRAGDVKTYWEKHAVWGDAFAKSIFTRDRFLAIRHNLTWCDTSNITPEERTAQYIVLARAVG